MDKFIYMQIYLKTVCAYINRITLQLIKMIKRYIFLK